MTLILEMQLVSVEIALGELCQPLMNDEQLAAFYKLRETDKLWRMAIKEGWEEFDWNKAHELGWLCIHDYSVFEELAEFREAVEREHNERISRIKAAE
jgi:hypothetical protein